MTLFSDDLHALRDTLLQIKKVKLSVDVLAHNIDERSRLRLYEFCHSSPIYRTWKQPDIDQWLLIHDIIEYKRRPLSYSETNYDFCWEEIVLTDAGVDLCSELFYEGWDRSHSEGRREYLETAYEIAQTIYLLDEPRKWEVRPYLALSGLKVLGVSSTYEGAQSAFFDMDAHQQSIVRVYPQYKLPPYLGACISASYRDYCVEHIWKPENRYERITRIA